MRKPLVVMERDLDVLSTLYAHRTLGSTQLWQLCFGDASYETARKRLRRLKDAQLAGVDSSQRVFGRGRPELAYYLTRTGATVIEQHRPVGESEIPVGPAHAYHKERFFQIGDIHLSLRAAERKRTINDLRWLKGSDFARHWSRRNQYLKESPDAFVSFAYRASSPLSVLIEMDTGNFRQVRNWQPKMESFLSTNYPIWIVTNSVSRIETLAEWTLPILKKFKVGAGKCVFAVYQDIVDKGIFQAPWLRTDLTLTDLRPR